MGDRMDRYKNENSVPTRSDKNQELYKQIYNAYDDFENLIIPSNAREITMSELKKEITTRKEYREKKAYDVITDKSDSTRQTKSREKMRVQNNEPQVYDIKELLDRAVSNHDDSKNVEQTLSNREYLKKIRMDNYTKTNIERVKEAYEDSIDDDDIYEDESLLKTANLSLEILSDLKSDNDSTMSAPPIKESELPRDAKDIDFYSSNYKFRKNDFEDKDGEDEDFVSEDGKGFKTFIKVLLLVFGILLIIIILLYIFKFFNRV